MFHSFKKVSIVRVVKTLCLLFLILFCLEHDAQVFYSVNPKYLRSKTEQNNLLSDYKYTYPDTSITEQSNYFPRNFMGNMGLASPDYIWRYGTEDLGFRLVQSPLTSDKISESEVKYFRTMGPYASLNGIAGSKEFQIFRMLFTHTYKDKVNVTVGFNRYTSKGFYNRQQTYTNNFYLSSNYTNKEKSSGYYFYIMNNGNKNNESGGIKDGVLTDSSMVFDKALFANRLTEASRDNRELKVMVNPWIRLNKIDSTSKLNQYVQLKSKFSTQSYRYKDAYPIKDSFYTAIFLDTLKTQDSSHVMKISNELSYSLLSTDNKFGFSVGYKNEVNKVWQKIDSVFINHFLQSDLVYRTALVPKDSTDKRVRFFDSRVNFQFGFLGPAKGNLKLEGNSVFTFNDLKKRAVFFNLLLENRSPDYIYNNWVSNHFLWFNNGFKDQQQVQAKLGVNLNRFFQASVFFHSTANYLYFDQENKPQQFSGPINNVGVNLNFTKIFFKHLGIGLNHIYQNTPEPKIVRVPANVSTIKLFYNGSLAKNNLQLQIGAQLQVYESFYALAYMPSTQTFYLQDQFKTSTYPYLDVYLNARIRPVNFFLKVENVLQSLAGPNYSFVPGYYQTDLAFRFGLTWMFFD
ncbi:hypothetical protein CNR22_13020 [Sphingobacteriaceae bacterium]|nr:hypothetical protein CNR22_13020 [Sphingobacteriaceae bacterium]